jgi:5-(carboxyamino)imidazole ribonucleotide mutase
VKIVVLMGSMSDKPFIEPIFEILKEFDVSYEGYVISAHRSPDALRDFIKGLDLHETKVIIAIAGGSAALPGVVASYVDIPVIGVPVPTKNLGGIDSLLSMTQMPSGVPVATVGIGEGGTKNAAYLALRILALEDEDLKMRLAKFKERLAEGVKKID